MREGDQGKGSPGLRGPGLRIQGGMCHRIRVHPRTSALGRLPLSSGPGRGGCAPALRPNGPWEGRPGYRRVRRRLKTLCPMPLHPGTVGHSGTGTGWTPPAPTRFPLGAVAQPDACTPLPGTGSEGSCAVRLIDHVVGGQLDEGTRPCHHDLLNLPGLAAVQAFHDVSHRSSFNTHSTGKQAWRVTAPKGQCLLVTGSGGRGRGVIVPAPRPRLADGGPAGTDIGREAKRLKPRLASGSPATRRQQHAGGVDPADLQNAALPRPPAGTTPLHPSARGGRRLEPTCCTALPGGGEWKKSGGSRRSSTLAAREKKCGRP